MLPSTFLEKELMAQLAAKMLIEIEAIHFRPEDPFTLTSGLVSPVYIDCRKLISYPRIRSVLMDFCTALILRDIGFEQIESVAGGETAGIPFAAWIAERLELPMNYVRKKPKGFGRDAQIEGNSIEGKRVLLVEDLTTDAGSKIKFCEAIRKAGGEVSDAIVIFFYDIFPQARANLETIGIDLHYLTTWRDVLEVSRKNDFFDKDILSSVENFLNDPLAWSGAHGGVDDIALLGKKE